VGFWRKANTFRELLEFLLSYVATIILAIMHIHIAKTLLVCYHSSHYVC
jgi:hypothetical protein